MPRVVPIKIFLRLNYYTGHIMIVTNMNHRYHTAIIITYNINFFTDESMIVFAKLIQKYVIYENTMDPTFRINNDGIAFIIDMFKPEN